MAAAVCNAPIDAPVVDQAGNEEGCLVNSRIMCQSSVRDAREALNDIAHLRRYRSGQTIIAEGTPLNFIGNLVSGIVKLTKVTPDGDQQIVGLLFPSDFVGRAFSENWVFSAEAATDVELCCLERRAFERVLKDHPSLEHEFLIAALDELDAAREWMLLLGRKSAQEKVASFLMMLVDRNCRQGCLFGQETSMPIRLPITRADMAGYLGMSVETVSRKLTEMRTNRLIRLVDAHHFVVLDEKRLCATANEEPSVGF